jgi:hypothetical protein
MAEIWWGEWSSVEQLVVRLGKLQELEKVDE